MSAHVGKGEVLPPPTRKRPRRRSRPKGVWHNCEPQPHVFYVAAADVAREDGANRNSFSAWLRNNKLRPRCYIAPDKRLMVPAEYAARWRKETERRPHLHDSTPKHERVSGKAALELLGCAHTLLDRAVANGQVRRYRSGSAYYYLRPELERLKLELLTRPPSWLVELPDVAERLGRTRYSLTTTVRRNRIKTTVGWSPKRRRRVSFIDIKDAEELLGEPWEPLERAA